MAIAIDVREGRRFSRAEQAAFIDLVSSGGEVAEHTLRQNVPGAKCLVFLRDGASLCGVAALKNPIPHYRTSLQNKAGIAVDAARFPFELGYVLVAPEARRKGYGTKLVDAALGAAGSQGVFATSRSDNPAMHTTLKRFGFERAGQEYAGRDPSQKIQLFFLPKAQAA